MLPAFYIVGVLTAYGILSWMLLQRKPLWRVAFVWAVMAVVFLFAWAHQPLPVRIIKTSPAAYWRT
jgi:hypothetical protein